MGNIAMGIDIGGTKIAVALVNTQGEISYRTERVTDTSSKEALFSVLLACIETVLTESKKTLADLAGIGIGLPGKVDVDEGIAVFQNNIPWANFPLVERLQKALDEEIEIIIDNDVKMAAYAEYKNQQLAPKDLFTYVTISTGIAAASIIDDKIIRGSGFSGEIGFIPIKTQPENTYETLENLASGPAIAARFGEMNLRTKDVFARYYEGDKAAQEFLTGVAEQLALGLYSIICVLDPKVIVLGGSVAYRNPPFVEDIKQALSQFLIAEQSHILDSISISEFESDNGIVGAGLKILS